MGLVVKKFGFIAFLIGVLGFGLALYLGQNLDYSTQEIVGWVVMGMTSALVYFGIAYQRDTVNAGRISFGQALKTGLVIAVMGGLGIALSDVVYTLFINPDFFDQYNAYTIQLVEESGDTQAVDKIKEQQELFKNYGPTEMSLLGGFMMFVMTFSLGVFVTVISAFILRKDS